MYTCIHESGMFAGCEGGADIELIHSIKPSKADTGAKYEGVSICPCVFLMAKTCEIIISLFFKRMAENEFHS